MRELWTWQPLLGHILRLPCPERSSAWLERLLWEQEVAGSNPVVPTNPKKARHRRAFFVGRNDNRIRPATSPPWSWRVSGVETAGRDRRSRGPALRHVRTRERAGVPCSAARRTPAAGAGSNLIVPTNHLTLHHKSAGRSSTSPSHQNSFAKRPPLPQPNRIRTRLPIHYRGNVCQRGGGDSCQGLVGEKCLMPGDQYIGEGG